MRQVGYLQEIYRDTRSTEHKILRVAIFLKPIETLDGVYSYTHALIQGKYRHIPNKWVK